MNRTPTINQLIAACESDNEALRRIFFQVPVNNIYKVMRMPTAVLQSGSAADQLVRPVSYSFSAEAQAQAKVAWQCFIRETLNGRAGRFRTPTMTVRAVVDRNTLGRRDY